MAQRCSGHSAAEVIGSILLAGTMDLLVQPTLQPPKVPAAEVVIQSPQIVPGLLHELSGVKGGK
jgi:hypothetical protein